VLTKANKKKQDAMDLKSALARIGRIEAARGQEYSKCLFCEQYYWVMTALGDVIGPDGKYQPESTKAGLRIAEEQRTDIRAVREALEAQRGIEEVHPDGPLHYVAPPYKPEALNARVEIALEEIEESRPRRPGCLSPPCWLWPVTVNVEAGVLHDYPSLSFAAIEALEDFKRRPLEDSMLNFQRRPITLGQRTPEKRK
jgi:hypothetical protein